MNRSVLSLQFFTISVLCSALVGPESSLPSSVRPTGSQVRRTHRRFPRPKVVAGPERKWQQAKRVQTPERASQELRRDGGCHGCSEAHAAQGALKLKCTSSRGDGHVGWLVIGGSVCSLSQRFIV
ncbi:unnamed protein product [Jaminaea pallidilutea]